MRQTISRFLILAFIVPWALGRLAAQSHDEPPPGPTQPLLPRAPDMAAWTVTYTYKDAAPDKTASSTTVKAAPYIPERLTTLQVVKTGTTYHLTCTYSTGRKSESWIVAGREVQKMPEGPLYLHCAGGYRYDDFTQSDFEELSWLTLQDYTGVKKLGTRSLFTFSADNMTRDLNRREKMAFALGTAVAPPLGATPEQIKALQKKATAAYKASTFGGTTSTVQLDATTQLPVEWDDGKIDRVYDFAAPPTDNLVPPPEVAAEFKVWSQQAPR